MKAVAFPERETRNAALARWRAAARELPRAALETVRELFDAEHYLASGGVGEGAESPLEDYLAIGWREGRDPHLLFDSAHYLEHYSDVREAEVNPLLHYALDGGREGRDPHPLFAAGHYLRQVPEAAREAANPLLHFLRVGWRSGLDPHPLFHTDFYLAQAPECAQLGIDPLSHYQTVGASGGLDPHPLFDSSYYHAHHPQCRLSGVDPLSHFLTRGAAADADPHPFFSSGDYRQALAGEPHVVNPLLHFVTVGEGEGRLPRGEFDLGRDKHLVTELDELRHDGRRVLLFLSGGAGGRPDDELLGLAERLAPRCVALWLRPADQRLLGRGVRDLLALSPVLGEGPGLLFAPRSQTARLVAVLRGVGVTRVLVRGSADDCAALQPILQALGLPFDLALDAVRYRGWLRRGWLGRLRAMRGPLAWVRGNAERRVVPLDESFYPDSPVEEVGQE